MWGGGGGRYARDMAQIKTCGHVNALNVFVFFAHSMTQTACGQKQTIHSLSSSICFSCFCCCVFWFVMCVCGGGGGGGGVV